MTCPTCGAAAAKTDTYCSVCVTPLYAPPPRTRRPRSSLIGALAFGLLAVFVIISLVAGVINRNAGSPDGPSPDFAVSASGAPTSPPATVAPTDLLHAHADVGHTVATTTGSFTVSGSWTERYSYDCGTGSTPEQLWIQVIPASGPNRFVDIKATRAAVSGHGEHRVRASGRFRLLVRTPQSCSWTVTVLR
jgi:hypothetical protein